MGNTVVVVPSERYPLLATDLYQVFDTSDVPGGVINIVTGAREALVQVLAEHDDVDAVWYAGTAEGRQAVEAASIGNMKRTWTHLEAELSFEDLASRRSAASGVPDQKHLDSLRRLAPSAEAVLVGVGQGGDARTQDCGAGYAGQGAPGQ